MNESSIYFFPGGGHDHDGENSSLIDTNVYSIFDFGWEIFGDPNRQNRQTLNYNGFRQFVVDTVNQSIIQPAGVVFQEGVINGNAHIITGSITSNEIAANTITANNILAGTITANLLSANIVLVDQIIASNNYVAGVSGWKIDGDGTAEFDSASIRGAISAAAVVIDANNAWDNTGFILGGNTGIYTSNGVVRIGTSVVIEGTIVADQIAIDDNNLWNNNEFVLGGNTGIYTSNGVVRIGTSVVIEGAITADAIAIDGNNYWLSNGVFRVGNNSNVLYFDGTDLGLTGDVTTSNLIADGGLIAGWSIDEDYIFANSASGYTIIRPTSDYSTPFLEGADNVYGRTSLYWGTVEVVSNGAYGPVTCEITPGQIITDSVAGRTEITSGTITTDHIGTNTINAITYQNLPDFSDASSVSGYAVGTGFGPINSLPVREGDGSIGAAYFRFNGDVTVGTGNSSEIRRRDDGYILTVTSRRELKNSIESLNASIAIDIIKKLKPVTYRWNTPQAVGKLYDDWNKNYREYGFITQDVESVDSNLVSYKENKEKTGIESSMWSNHGIVSISVAAIQGLITEIQDLKQRIKALEQQLGYNS